MDGRSRLHEAADIIQKLQLIAQDLPPGKFVEAQADIDTKYNEIQKSLVDEFIKGHKSNDRQRMKELVNLVLILKMRLYEILRHDYVEPRANLIYYKFSLKNGLNQ